MLDKTKCDDALGFAVHGHLQKHGVETPTIHSPLTSEKKIELVQEHFIEIMTLLGLDLSDDSLAETPKRVAKMFVNEIFWGLNPANFPKCTTVENKMHYDEMVVETSINVSSVCEHHLVVIDGFATVAYIPKDRVLGLSKIPRIVEYFSKRPQIQERLTEQVFYALEYILKTSNIAVLIEAQHYCVKSRGVEDRSARTITSKLGGCFYDDPAVRSEFMALARERNR